jgi:transposase
MRVRIARDELRRLRELTQTIKALEAEIAQLVTQLAPQLLAEPGFGPLTAAKLLGEILDVKLYESARQLAAFAGLAPRLHESGSSIRRKARLSKVGAPRLRKALYFPAIVAMRHNPHVRAMSERLKERGKCPMQIIGAAMRKLAHLAYGVLKSGKPFDPEIKTA